MNSYEGARSTRRNDLSVKTFFHWDDISNAFVRGNAKISRHGTVFQKYYPSVQRSCRSLVCVLSGIEPESFSSNTYESFISEIPLTITKQKNWSFVCFIVLRKARRLQQNALKNHFPCLVYIPLNYGFTQNYKRKTNKFVLGGGVEVNDLSINRGCNINAFVVCRQNRISNSCARRNRLILQFTLIVTAIGLRRRQLSSRTDVVDKRSYRLFQVCLVGRDNKIIVVPEDESDRCRTSVLHVRVVAGQHDAERTRPVFEGPEFINFLGDIFSRKRVRVTDRLRANRIHGRPEHHVPALGFRCRTTVSFSISSGFPMPSPTNCNVIVCDFLAVLQLTRLPRVRVTCLDWKARAHAVSIGLGRKLQ